MLFSKVRGKERVKKRENYWIFNVITRSVSDVVISAASIHAQACSPKNFVKILRAKRSNQATTKATLTLVRLATK